MCAEALHVHLDASRHFSVRIRTGEEEACHGHLPRISVSTWKNCHTRTISSEPATAPTAASTAKVISWTSVMPSVRSANERIQPAAELIQGRASVRPSCALLHEMRGLRGSRSNMTPGHDQQGTGTG